MMDKVKKPSNSKKNTLVTIQVVSTALLGKSILHDVRTPVPCVAITDAEFTMSLSITSR
jgi:hypothetical protein